MAPDNTPGNLTATQQEAQALETSGAVQDSPLTALDLVNQAERKIQLEGARDPENFRLPNGSTLAETQRQNEAAQIAEGKAADAANMARVRELGSQNAKKPENTKVDVNRTGQILTADAPKVGPASEMQNS